MQLFCPLQGGISISIVTIPFAVLKNCNEEEGVGDDADLFKVPNATISDWISDIRTKQKGSRNNLIYKLSLLDWTQQEIGDKVGLSRTGVESILDENSDFGKNVTVCKKHKHELEKLPLPTGAK